MIIIFEIYNNQTIFLVNKETETRKSTSPVFLMGRYDMIKNTFKDVYVLNVFFTSFSF